MRMRGENNGIGTQTQTQILTYASIFFKCELKKIEEKKRRRKSWWMNVYMAHACIASRQQKKSHFETLSVRQSISNARDFYYLLLFMPYGYAAVMNELFLVINDFWLLKKIKILFKWNFLKFFTKFQGFLIIFCEISRFLVSFREISRLLVKV